MTKIDEIIKDNTDFIEEFTPKVGLAESYKEAMNEIDKNLYLKATDLLKIEYPKNQWLVEGLIPLNAITIISSAPASFKTWLLLQIALDVSNGKAFLNKFSTHKTGVLLIDEESGDPILQNRLKMIIEENMEDIPIYFRKERGFQLNKEDIEKTIGFCQRNDIKVIAFDSLVRIHNSDENDANKMSKVFKLLYLYKQENITVILIHHNRKEIVNTNSPQSMRGSTDILAAADCHISIRRNDKKIIVRQTKSRVSEEIKPFEIEVNSNKEHIEFKYISEVEEKEDKLKDFKEFIIDILKEHKELNKKEIFELSKSLKIGGYSTMKSALLDMEKNNEIISKTGEKNSKIYYLNLAG
ncbi:AAA family ATPase [bacterium]|nr:AAA family ATPase [bacterium]